MSAVLDRLRALGERAGVLATVIDSAGAGSARVGATMVVDCDGAIVGGLTIGGCVDARVRDAAAGVLANGRATTLDVALGGGDAAAMGLACAGTIAVEVEPAAGLAEVYARAAELAHGGGAIVVRRAGGVSRLVVASDGRSAGSTGDETLDAAIRESAPQLRESSGSGEGAALDLDGARIVVERIAPPATVLIAGAGEIATALVAMLRLVGMRTVLVEGRASHAEAARAAGADAVTDEMAHVAFDGESKAGEPPAVVVLAHDYRIEAPLLERALAGGAPYVGMLASHRRAGAVRALLAERGVAAEALARIRSPIGVSIGAQGPAEIALAIAAELVQARRAQVAR